MIILLYLWKHRLLFLIPTRMVFTGGDIVEMDSTSGLLSDSFTSKELLKPGQSLKIK